MFCGNCGRKLTGAPKKCSSCGARPMFGTHFCPECGAQTTSLTEICVRCGARVEKEISEDGTSKKKILGIIAGCVVGIIIGVFIAAWPSTPTQVNTYSKYGFSFEYPKAFSVTETGTLESKANDSSGVVEFLWTENGEPELCVVGWTAATPAEMEIWPGGLEGYVKDVLEFGIAALEISEETASFEKGELGESTKAGHLMFYQYYAHTPTEGDKVYGVISCFYCDNSQNFFH